MTRPPVEIVAVTVPHLAEAVLAFGFIALVAMWIAIGAMPVVPA